MRQTMVVRWQLEMPTGLDVKRTGPYEGRKELIIITRFQLIPGSLLVRVHSQVHNKTKNHKLKTEFRTPGAECHGSGTAFDLVREEMRKPSADTARPNKGLEICRDPSNLQIYAGDAQIIHIGI